MRKMYGLLALAALASLTLLACSTLAGRALERVESHVAPADTPDAEGSALKSVELSQEEEAINARPLKLPLADARIVVQKSARRLTLYAGGERVRVYAAALGFEPSGDKEKQGDGRTPEGTFYVCMKNERSRFYLSLGLSYPNSEDAERGLRDKLITQAQHDRILRAIEQKGKPPWDTPLGGEIFIHGGGTANDWTSGCVALANENIKELFDAVPLGTMVVIEH
jgi:murein L,D-transpeptidase YafK